MTDKKKILFAITKSNFGGAQRYVYDMATGLPHDQYDVVVVAGGNGPLFKKLQQANIRTISIPLLGRDVRVGNDLKVFLFLKKIFRDEKPDVVHLNSSKIGGIGALAARIVHIPKIVFTSHGWAFNENRSFISKVVIRFSVWITLLLSHSVITVSYALQRDVLSFPFIGKKLILIHNGISTVPQLVKSEVQLFFKDKLPYVLPENTFWIATIAELHKNKGLPYLLDAAAQLKNSGTHVFFVIMGAGEEKENLLHHIYTHGLENNVLLVGHVDNAPSYLSAFDGYVLPSITEALGLSILEAGMASIPVIATNVGGIPEIIENGVSGTLVPAKDPAAIAHAITSLIDDEHSRNNLAHALHKRVVSDFTRENMLEATVAVYKN